MVLLSGKGSARAVLQTGKCDFQKLSKISKNRKITFETKRNVGLQNGGKMMMSNLLHASECWTILKHICRASLKQLKYGFTGEC